MDEQRYEIQDGVRRAKAAWLCGRETIHAQVGGVGDIIQVPIKNLRSPKPVIEDNDPRGASWGIVYRMTQRGQDLPPIEILSLRWRSQKMNSNFSDSAIRAIHKVIAFTRYLGYKDTNPQVLARILDHADALGFMLMDDFRPEDGEELPSLFRAHLRDMEEKFDGLQGLTQAFDENMKRGRNLQERGLELTAASA